MSCYPTSAGGCGLRVRRCSGYLNGPLHSFFLAQSLVERGDPLAFWAMGSRAGGIVEFYMELLGTKDVPYRSWTSGLPGVKE